MNDHAILALGLVAQALFSARFLVQWLASERAKRSVIPRAFWFLSLAASVLLLTYAVLRRDPVFMLAQSINLIVYCRNLQLLYGRRRNGPSGRRPYVGRITAGIALLLIVIGGITAARGELFAAPPFWLALGFSGQIIFNSRFALQLIASERRGEPVLPRGFWHCSLIGSVLLFIYACWRRDPVFMLAQGPNIFIFARNLQLLRREARTEKRLGLSNS
jgi:lipid-A-disaccharide synthase-like uncharacterized protein